MGRPRIDNFVGSSQAYVGYLEDKLLSLRYHHRQCLFFETQPDATSSALTTEQAHCNESQFDVHEAPSTKSAQVPGHTRGQKRKNGSTALEDPPPGFENSKWHKKYSEIVRNDSEAPSEATHNQPLFLTWPSNWKQDHDCVQSRLRWKNIVQHLVSITPKGKGWWEAIRNLGAYEGTCNSRATLFLLDNGQSYQDAVPGMGSTRPMSDYESPLLHHIANIASTATGRGKAAELTLALANFQKFLVLCSCVVLQHSKAPTDRIYDIVKICAGNISEDYCQRLLRTVVYLNKMIDTLDSNGWINRASELLLLCRSKGFSVL